MAFGSPRRSGALGIFALIIAFFGLAAAIVSIVHHLQPASLLIPLAIEGLAVVLGIAGLLVDRLRGTPEGLTYVGLVVPLCLGAIFLLAEWSSVFG